MEYASPPLAEALERVDAMTDELVELTLALAATTCPPGREHVPAAVAARWLDAHGFAYDVVGAPERPSLVVRIAGSADHASLLLNSHLDEPFDPERDWLRLRDPHARQYTDAWLEGDLLCGYGVVNDKGPMAATLVAAAALRDASALRGELVLTLVAGEIGQNPADEFQGHAYEGTGMGTRAVLAAGVRTDFAVVAEATSFAAAWVEAGQASLRVVVEAGPSYYTPFLPRPLTARDHPNAIVRIGRVVDALETWADRYQERETRRFDGGSVVPKASVSCVRSGVPYNLERTPEIAFLYVDVRTVPGADIAAIADEVARVTRCRVDVLAAHAGAEARGVEPLLAAAEAASHAELGSGLTAPSPEVTSMWRDVVPLAHAGIPTITYGPTAGTGGARTFAMSRADLVTAARLYTRIAHDVCARRRVT